MARSSSSSSSASDAPRPRPLRQQSLLAGATLSEAEGVRYLHLGTEWVQGAMRIRAPRKLELVYAQRMMAWLLWRESVAPDAGRVAHLGLGAGALTRFTHQVLRWPTTTVELNPSVIAANRLWFHLPPEDARFELVTGDAGAWIADAERAQSLDALTVDLYDHDAAAPVLDSPEFYAACHRALAPGGLMSVNLFGRRASFARSTEAIAQSFGADQVWQLTPTDEGNVIVVAARGVVVPDREVLTARAEAIEQQLKLPARKWLRMVRPWRATGG